MTKNAKSFLPARRGMRHLLAVAASVLLLAACGTPGRAIDPQAQAAAMAAKPVAPAAADFPALETAKWQQGAFPNLENLRQVQSGMGKDQIRELLSWPHFSEGLWGVEEWNYIFHLRSGEGPAFVTCQYMVRFNDAMVVTGAYWKSGECEALTRPVVKTAAAKPIVQALPTPPARPLPPQKISLGTDGLFRFGGGSASDLQPEGRQKIELLTQEIRRNFASVNSIVIMGHTDRLGSAAYNEALSLERANTVRDLMARAGVDETLIKAVGMGKTRPVVDCPGFRKSPALVACLQPNRRVELEVVGAVPVDAAGVEKSASSLTKPTLGR
ncbi:Outer membrane protein II* [Variovorax sp. PBS-H4]|nr:Outer membrane protein II* [Variovorax sp. PBS-H4]